MELKDNVISSVAYNHVVEFLLMQIGHLAEIADPDVARVLSWHMSSDIDCVVTRTTQTVIFFPLLKSWLLILVWKESCQTI